MFDVFSKNEFRLIRQACQVHGQQALKLLSFFFSAFRKSIYMSVI